MNLRNGPTREFDVILFIASLALVVYGLLLIYSGSLSNYGDGAQSLSHPVARQAVFAVLGVIAMITMSRVDYRLLGPLSITIYILSLAALMFVLVAGSSEYGARRWITVAGTDIQPSEIAKICTVVMLAKYLSDHDETVQTVRVFATSFGIAVLPALLVLVEPDLGSALVFLVLWAGMVVIAGARPSHIIGMFASAAILAPFALLRLAHDYQLDRFRSWLRPEDDAAGAGFNILQAETSIGSGRLWGKGYTEGTQTQLDYLRTQTTDYIFSVGAEELGFVGAMALFALFIIVLFRILRVARHADDAFGRLIAAGIVSLLLFQVFVNIGVNIRLVPVTGVPLPFVSQGGSSLVTMLGAVGLVQSILGHRRRRRTTA